MWWQFSFFWTKNYLDNFLLDICRQAHLDNFLKQLSLWLRLCTLGVVEIVWLSKSSNAQCFQGLSQAVTSRRDHATGKPLSELFSALYSMSWPLSDLYISSQRKNPNLSDEIFCHTLSNHAFSGNFNEKRKDCIKFYCVQLYFPVWLIS